MASPDEEEWEAELAELAWQEHLEQNPGYAALWCQSVRRCADRVTGEAVRRRMQGIEGPFAADFCIPVTAGLSPEYVVHKFTLAVWEETQRRLEAMRLE